MTNSAASTELLSNYNAEEPNHVVFWLHAHIGMPEEHIHLKKAFGSNTDPRSVVYTMLNDKDYDYILGDAHAQSVIFEGVNFLLQAFTNVEACLEAFEKNQDKRIFFITSGSLGRHAVPKIMERYRHIFTDPITNRPYPSVYIYCRNIEFQMDWALEYYEYVQAFNFDADLLERLTRDIAEYYIERGRRLLHDDYLKGALQCLLWAKRLWHQSDIMEQGLSSDDLRVPRESQRMKEINQLIQTIEGELPVQLSDEEGASSDDD